MLWRIMRLYAQFGHKDFYLALAYHAELIKEYFLNYRPLNADLTVELATGSVRPLRTDETSWRVTLVDTGLESMTGGRAKRMQKFVGHEPFMLTYGDGVAKIDLDSSLSFHKKHGKRVTETAVRPDARLGELKITGDQVASFQEKPQMGQGWSNGGIFVLQPEFFDLIQGDSMVLEREPLERVAKMGGLVACRHNGFWQCMDTKRDKDLLEGLWQSKKGH